MYRFAKGDQTSKKCILITPQVKPVSDFPQTNTNVKVGAARLEVGTNKNSLEIFDAYFFLNQDKKLCSLGITVVAHRRGDRQPHDLVIVWLLACLFISSRGLPASAVFCAPNIPCSTVTAKSNVIFPEGATDKVDVCTMAAYLPINFRKLLT